ncbi:hypothetical protein QFC21_004191 [Naganishia friedmannii]|uniref:Uncharacterized protein n=1 Tax=Naganishia friedmannii TaxID=89922 RepID=A0ACC2VIT0_9TREE|nr:hypothetical protein QFC21_004191 [Naganishia friedmannii]
MITDSIANDPGYKHSLPSEFLHGYASASYQIEGGYQQDGRGLSNWDVYLKDRDNGNDAVDSYNRWREDVKLLKQYGCDVYRFSVSWSRVKPLGGKDDPVNEKGVQYYSDLIDALLEAGIKPLLTIYHWDLPLKLQERYNGFCTPDSSLIVEDFVAYSRLLFERFGDRVKDWITINEPHAVTIMSSTGLVPDWMMKTSPWMRDKADRSGSRSFGLNHYGTRWATGIKYDTESKLRDDVTLHDKFEFFCGNIEATPRGKDGKMIGNEGNLAQVYDVPWGFRKVLQHVHKEYAEPNGIKIYVTENGFTIAGETTMTTIERVNDVQRQAYFDGYIKQLIDAVREDGIPIAGYMGWSLLDNLEWWVLMKTYKNGSRAHLTFFRGRGWSQTVGVTYVDRDNDFERIPKDTTRLLKQVWEHVVADHA